MSLALCVAMRDWEPWQCSHASWAWLWLYEARASEHAHGDPKWRPIMNVATEYAKKTSVGALTKR